MKIVALLMSIVACAFFGSILLIFLESPKRSWATPHKDYWSNLQEKDMVHVRAEMVKISGQSYFRVATKDWNSRVPTEEKTNYVSNVKSDSGYLVKENEELKEMQRQISEMIIYYSTNYNSGMLVCQTNKINHSVSQTNSLNLHTNIIGSYLTCVTNRLDYKYERLQEKYNKIEKEYNELKALQPILQNPASDITPFYWNATNVSWITNLDVDVRMNDTFLTNGLPKKTNQEQKNLELFKAIDEYNKKHPVSLIETSKGSKQ